MIDPLPAKTDPHAVLRNGEYFLIRDADNSSPVEWALARYVGLSDDLFVVGWNGVAIDNPRIESGRWAGTGTDRFLFFPLTKPQAEAAVMAARHLPDELAWYRYCERVTNEQHAR